MNKRNKNYKLSELTNDTLKIVKEVEKLIQKDGITNVKVSVFFEYVKKVEDKLWENKNRNYYLHNVPLESISEDAQMRENIMLSKEPNIEEHMIKKDNLITIRNMLRNCTCIDTVQIM